MNVPNLITANGAGTPDAAGMLLRQAVCELAAAIVGDGDEKALLGRCPAVALVLGGLRATAWREEVIQGVR